MTIIAENENCVPNLPAPKKRRGIHPLFLDLGLTTVTSGAVLVAGLVVVALFGKLVGAVALGEYLLLRRVYQWLQSVSLLGINNALPRYVAMTDNEPSERDRYLLASILFGGLTTLICVVVLCAGRFSFSNWFFGRSELGPLVLALALFLAGGSAHGVVYGFYRGRLEMKKANALQTLNMAVVPVAAVVLFFHTRSAATIVDAMGIGTLFFALLFGIPLLPKVFKVRSLGAKQPIATLLRYSVPRVPAIFGLGALLAAGPVVASHVLPMKEVLALLLGMSIMGGISASADPLGLILLSKVSMIVSQDRLGEFRVHLEYLQEAVIACYVFICLQVIVFADVLVKAWVGSRLVGGMDVIRLTLVAVPFYLLFAALRSVIDASSVTPYNMYNIMISGAVFVALLGAAVFLVPRQFVLLAITSAIVTGFVVLAWLTVRTTRKLFALEINWKRCGYSISLSGALAGLSLLLRHAMGWHITLVQAALIAIPVSALFVAALRVSRLPWLPFFWNLALQRRNAHA
ncbi:MAG TPA: oligosaccharide flippase family protein [Candidatus Acidoferrales bacterium]|nr:oligosaccharide flippase family protein [Candidatus Acidoferrales bacterium]